jgi:hypothetical protein
MWTPMATNTANADGVVSFQDLETTNSPQRFYRLQWP